MNFFISENAIYFTKYNINVPGVGMITYLALCFKIGI